MKKIILYGIAGLSVLLFITNPSLRDFKDNGHIESRKSANWLLFSIFKENTAGETRTYIGLMKNFILTNNETNPIIFKEWK